MNAAPAYGMDQGDGSKAAQLQAQFKESQDALEKLKEDSAPVIKMLKAATPSGNSAGGKDEV